MKTWLLVAILIACIGMQARPQSCTPVGDQTTYGSGDIWIGYVYDNSNLTGYAGYVNAGTAGNPTFDVSFGGDQVNYATNGCAVYTETFSVRYKLQKTFAAGNYEFTVGADDGYRLSVDGGSTWLIDRWTDQSYAFTTATVYLSGAVNLVLEYYENGGYNRVTFSVAATCAGVEDQSIYGSGNIWRGYIYDGTNFNAYKGMVLKGTGAMNAFFDENFGGDNVTYNTSCCSINTETFSVRYRLRKNFSYGTYVFLVGADDGYRLSLDGGATWVINMWSDHGYNNASYTATLNGTRDMVLEFYENGGGNRVSFDLSWTLLPVHLTQFTGEVRNSAVNLNWSITSNSNADRFVVERSGDGKNFQRIGEVKAGDALSFRYADYAPPGGALFYRLQMVDANGVVTLSDVVTVKTPAGLRIVQSGGSLYANAPLVLYDMQGRVLLKNDSPGTVYTNRLPKGLYTVRAGTFTKTIFIGN